MFKEVKRMKTKNLSTYITAGIFIISIISGYAKLQAQSNQTKEKVAEITIKQELLKEDIKEIEKDVVVGSTQTENVSKQIEDVKAQTDKIIDLLLDMKKGE